MALFIVKDIVESYIVIFLTTILGTIVSSTTEAIPGYTSIILSNIVILIVPKVLYNIIVTVK